MDVLIIFFLKNDYNLEQSEYSVYYIIPTAIVGRQDYSDRKNEKEMDSIAEQRCDEQTSMQPRYSLSHPPTPRRTPASPSCPCARTAARPRPPPAVGAARQAPLAPAGPRRGQQRLP